ncbi:hypothetical protein G3N09_14890 [Acinetobacter baumannii]|uniref:hypothetical protein n=1 Tax=Acinetobacter baumannii TaxID=470 RepID=UPI0013C617E7|nr:hypothetical protein [Acinetobacter baumannii]NDY15133.1 hypothetical protein [Acinetobacter baumannii]HAV5680094.1 hypothetical protein [Acinetobacter baumannii]HAV6219610.1 hypothetical protein [Acinetobacter baumannii]
MTDLNKEREVNLRFEQDDGAVWVFDGDSQQGTEISHLMMMHADEYNEDELRVICHHAACEIDRLRVELEKAKAQAVPDTHVILPIDVMKRTIGHIGLAMCHPNNYSYEEDIMAKDQEIIERAIDASESGAEQ